MRLTVATPLATVVSIDDVKHVRGEDASGAFGILPGHADFLTALAISVLRYRDSTGREHYVAVRGGMLRVTDRERIVVTTPEAIADDDLHHLEPEVLARFRRAIDEEQAARTDTERLRLAAIRQIIRLLRPGERAVPSIRTPTMSGTDGES